MASKTSTGQQYNARTMNGIIEIDATTITADSISSNNLTADFITANNLLEANRNETITAKWTYTQAPNILVPPADADDAMNKGYADSTYLTITDAIATYLSISNASLTYQTIADMVNYYTKAQIDANFLTITNASNTYVSQTTGLMDSGYSPSVAQGVATKVYVDGLISGGGLGASVFFPAVFNHRFQDPSLSPKVLVNAGYNTMIGYESCKHLQDDSLSFGNTYIGYRSGYYNGGIYAGVSLNTFLGAYAGWQNGNNNYYGFNRTTCVGFRSWVNKSDQVALGDANAEVKIRGTLDVDKTAYFNGSGAGLQVNTISNFLQDAYKKIGSISYLLLSELEAYTKTQVNATFLTISNAASTYLTQANAASTYETISNAASTYLTIANAASTYLTQATADGLYLQLFATTQNVLGTKNFNITNHNTLSATNLNVVSSTFTGIPKYSTGGTLYNILSELTAYTKTHIDATFQTIADMVNYYTKAVADATFIPRSLVKYVRWRVGIQNTSQFQTLTFNTSTKLFSGSLAATQLLIDYQTGWLGTGEGTSQMNTTTGRWTAQVSGMYKIDINIAKYYSYTSQGATYVNFYDAAGLEGINWLITGSGSGYAVSQQPYSVECSYSNTIYMQAGDSFEVISAYSSCLIYSYFKLTYMNIVRLTGY